MIESADKGLCRWRMSVVCSSQHLSRKNCLPPKGGNLGHWRLLFLDHGWLRNGRADQRIIRRQVRFWSESIETQNSRNEICDGTESPAKKLGQMKKHQQPYKIWNCTRHNLDIQQLDLQEKWSNSLEIDNTHRNIWNRIGSSICIVVVIVVVILVVHNLVSFFDVKRIGTGNGADEEDQERSCHETFESVQSL